MKRKYIIRNLKNSSFLYNCQRVVNFFIVILYISIICGCVSAKIYSAARPYKDRENIIPKEYNVVLIILDSVRADHLSCYGYYRNTSPAIDKLANEGILFEQAISQSNWSLPSHCSIFTSKYEPSHGIHDVSKKLSDSELTLAEILKIYGYRTAAFTGGFWLSSIFNINQGFDIYHQEKIFSKLKDTVPLAINWLGKNKEDKFFLFIQGFDGHSPFSLPKSYEEMYSDSDYNGIFKTMILDHCIGDRLFGYTFFLDYEYKKRVKIDNKDIEYIIAHYDASISYADKYIGEFLKKLDELGFRDNTIVILTSYHGTSLFEHGIILRRLHGGCTEGVIRVPLIIRHPGISKIGKRIETQVQHVDIMPTILDFLGIPINHQAQGKSLVSLIEGKTKADFNKFVYSTCGKSNVIRTKIWKLLTFAQPKEQKEAGSMTEKGVLGVPLAGQRSINTIPLPGSGEIYFTIYKRKIFGKDGRVLSLEDEDIKYIIAVYDEGINYVDQLIGEFLNKLSKLKLMEKTIIILTADHGEGLFDHDYFFHDFNLYESTIRVPLMIRIPSHKINKKEISYQVQLIDLMPTILELVGIEVNKDAQGHSLVPLIIGKVIPEEFNQYVFSETPQNEVSIRTDEWKLIYFSDKIELYNLKVDPKEKDNLAKQKPEIVNYLFRELQHRLTEKRKDSFLSQKLSLDNVSLEEETPLIKRLIDVELKRKKMYYQKTYSLEED